MRARISILFVVVLLSAPGRTAVAADAPVVGKISPIPRLVSPVNQFRRLLAMTEEERQRSLAGKTPAVRERLLAKLTEYTSLSDAEREARLQATELRWYLIPLLHAARTNRAPDLDSIPEHIRPLVADRVQRFNMLPHPLGEQLLENEEAVRFITQPNVTPAQQEQQLAVLSPERRAELEAGIDRINAMPEAERAMLFARFNTYLDLTSADRTRLLGRLGDTERKQMERTLDDFGRLNPAQRRKCLTAFDKFAGMNITERDQFLRNAEKWSSMSAAERLRWRELVRAMPDWPPRAPMPHLPAPRKQASASTN